MVAKEFYSDQEAGNEESTLLQDPYEEDEEEALSLCDLPIHSDSISAEWGDFSKEDGKNSQFNNNKDDDDDDNDLFEFFSEEFTTSSTGATAENIIFCGKLIPFKDHPHVPRREKKNLEISNTTKRSNIQKKGALPLVPNSFDTSKSVKSSDDASLKKGQEQEKAKGLHVKSFACDYTSMGKVSLVRSATKSRWFLFMFGMPKFPSNEMQLRDIRNRQSRRAPPAMFSAPEQGKEVKTKGSRRNCKGMWKMVRSISLLLGCSSSSKLANDVVKAAFV